MSEKLLQTRIQLKYDTLANWQSEAVAGKGALLVLKQGEMALCYVPSTQTETFTTAPTVLFKVGDGTTAFKSLPWGSGLSADVYEWAKQSTFAIDQDGTDGHKIRLKFGNDKVSSWVTIPDNNTQYQTVKDGSNDRIYYLQKKEVGESTWTNVSTITIPQSANDNQTVKAGTVTFGSNDVVDITAGSNVTVTGDATNKNITIASDAQTVKGNGTAFGANDAVDIVADGSNVTVTADTTNKKIKIASKNQTVKSGTTTFDADAVVNVVAGTNVTVTPSTTDNSLTIAATDTTYTAGTNVQISDTHVISATDTTYEFADTYSAESNKGATVATVTNAINALDVTVSGAAAGKTIGTLTQTDGKIAATFQDISITESQISNLGTAAMLKAGGEFSGDVSFASGKTLTINEPSANSHASTKKYVDDEIAKVSGGVVFKGTLGTGGTISTLPTAATANKGHMYKVITAGTYAGQAAVVGDLFVSSGSTTTAGTAQGWFYIPSGDEPAGTVTNVATGDGLTGGPITTSGTISLDTTYVATTGTSGHNGLMSSADKGTLDEVDTKISSAVEAGVATLDMAEVTLSGAKVLATIKETDGVVAVTTRDLTPANIGAATSTDITTAINALNVTEATFTGANVLSAISETNGKISTSSRVMSASDLSAYTSAQTDAKITAEIEKLDSSVSATAASGNVYSVLTGVTETDGKLTGKTEVTLAAIAKTGNVNDLVQTSGDVLVFDCGSSTTNV